MNGKKAKAIRRATRKAAAEDYDDFPKCTHAEHGKPREPVYDNGKLIGYKKGVPRRLGVCEKGMAKATKKVLKRL